MPWDIGDPGSGGGGDNFKNAEHEKHLLAFIGITSAPNTKTPYGEDDAARCEWIVCFTDGYVKRDRLVFGTAIVPALVDAGSAIVVARLVKGASAKPGQSPPWILETATDDEKAQAGAWLDGHAVKMPSGTILVEAPESAANQSF